MSTSVQSAIADGVYSLEEWSLVQHGVERETVSNGESLFALSNGFIGVRGSIDGGDPVWQPTTIINGFHDTWPIPYAEPAFGYATTGQTIVRVPDATRINVRIGNEALSAAGPATVSFERRLDMQAGALETVSKHQLGDGTLVHLKTTRLVSLTERHLMAILIEVAGAEGRDIEIRSALTDRSDSDQLPVQDVDDPRRTRVRGWSPLNAVRQEAEGARLVSTFVTDRSGLSLACGVEHVVSTTGPDIEADASSGTVVIHASGQDAPLRVAKFVAYHTDHQDQTNGLADAVRTSLDDAVASGFDELASKQRMDLADFWQEAAIEIGGDNELQKAVRWALFQLHQATACIENLSVPAKGLTGDAYEGHYFWDSEIYFLPFLAFTKPDVARELLRFRVGMLPEARRRAQELTLQGALFPWRTINGKAAGSYYPAGTAQYHINADIAYAIRQYTRATGDDDFLWDGGAEVLIETARLWIDLGFYDGESFHIHLVTGPDEYTALVNDNAYTNLMARRNLRFAAAVVERMKEEVADRFAQLAETVGLDSDEPTEWLRAADAMYIGHDEELGVTPQDSSFLSKERWDFEGTPDDKYPLLLHFHPLVIYRYQVLKQPDVVMAMLLLPDEFSEELKRANFDYYDPLTTGDSSLSSAVQATVAARIGPEDSALGYLTHSAFIDLGDLQGNTRDGLHLASAGGVWTALVRGFGGVRVADNGLVLDPKLPERWDLLRFRIRYRGSRLIITITANEVQAKAFGEAVDLTIAGEAVTVQANEQVTKSTG